MWESSFFCYHSHTHTQLLVAADAQTRAVLYLLTTSYLLTTYHLPLSTYELRIQVSCLLAKKGRNRTMNTKGEGGGGGVREMEIKVAAVSVMRAKVVKPVESTSAPRTINV